MEGACEARGHGESCFLLRGSRRLNGERLKCGQRGDFIWSFRWASKMGQVLPLLALGVFLNPSFPSIINRAQDHATVAVTMGRFPARPFRREEKQRWRFPAVPLLLLSPLLTVPASLGSRGPGDDSQRTQASPSVPSAVRTELHCSGTYFKVDSLLGLLVGA